MLGTGDERTSLQQVRSVYASAGGRAALAKLRAEGRDPAHGGDAAKRRGRATAAQMAAVAAWERDNDDAHDGIDFTRDVLPGLQQVPLRVMADATGLSEGYCSFVRRGRKVPHRRHWAALGRLSDELVLAGTG